MMIKSGKLLSQHRLSNGLTLELWDHSRPVAGDRFFVVMEARIAVPVREDSLPPELKPQSDQVIKALGSEIIFSQKEEHNFIAAAELPGLFKDMQDRILKLAPRYFGHEDFAGKFVRKAYLACQERQDWQAASSVESEPRS